MANKVILTTEQLRKHIFVELDKLNTFWLLHAVARTVFPIPKTKLEDMRDGTYVLTTYTEVEVCKLI